MNEELTDGVMHIRVYAWDRRTVDSYYSNEHPFQITPAGVIMEVGKISEVLIPWHRVQEISTAKRGTIITNIRDQNIM